jgi:hypothetical protein
LNGTTTVTQAYKYTNSSSHFTNPSARAEVVQIFLTEDFAHQYSLVVLSDAVEDATGGDLTISGSMKGFTDGYFLVQDDAGGESNSSSDF